MGPVANNEHLSLNDARWNERLAAVLLVGAIILMGVAPFLLKDLINPGTTEIMQKIVSTIK
jgi:NADH:ubiquinone oxidoreductase subunit 4 (subunit M)